MHSDTEVANLNGILRALNLGREEGPFEGITLEVAICAFLLVNRVVGSDSICHHVREGHPEIILTEAF